MLSPEYQRDYKWTKDEIHQFIADIFEAYDEYKKDKSYNHFFGTIITEEYKPNKGVNEYHLIDGQQRITTCILFVKHLQQIYQSHIEDKDISADEDIQDYLVKFRKILWVNGKEKDRLCKLISNKDGDTHILENVLTTTTSPTKENIFYKNYELLIQEYHDALKNQDVFKLEEFISFVFNNLEFIQVDTNSREAALKIFSVLNTRGLDLNSTDIIKAEAMAMLPKEKYRDFSAKWKELEKRADDLDLSFETVFRYYINMYRPSSIKGTNNTNIKDIWNEKFKNDKFSALLDFEKFINSVEYILNINDPYIWCLRHLLSLGKNAYTWVPVLVTMHYHNYSEIDICKVARYITKWHWLHLINNRPIEKIKSFNFALIKIINEQQNIDNILKSQPRIITHENESYETLSKTIFQNLLTMDIYNTKWGRPLLYFIFNIKNSELDKSAFEFAFKSITKNDTIEHINPQKSDDEMWINCSEDKKHTIGNLFIVSRSLNSSVGTSHDKKSIAYQRVPLAFTPVLTKNDPWTDERIDRRAKELVDVLCKAIDII